MFKNDERYWDINVLNKWFAISSIIFLAATVWTFIDDNDDEFKEYQREFRKMQGYVQVGRIRCKKSSSSEKVTPVAIFMEKVSNNVKTRARDTFFKHQ